jgi:hypothetical protein
LTSREPHANLGGRLVFGLYSSLASLSFSSVAWPSAVGVILGAVVGFGLAYLLIDRVLRAHIETPQPGAVRRVASACCLLWGLVLPLACAAGGLIWGVGAGVGSVVEGPVSTTVRETTHTWLTAANTLGVGVLKHLPLAKRLTERELLAVVQAAPDVITDALDQDRVGAYWQKATGAPMPPQLAAVLRHEFKALTSHHDEWLHPAVERLRARARDAGTSGPTVQEAIEAMVSPEVFHDAATTIRSTTRRDARNIGLVAILLAALLAGGLRLAWRRRAPAAAITPAPEKVDEPVAAARSDKHASG